MVLVAAAAAGCTTHARHDGAGPGRRVVEEKLLAASPGGPLERFDEVVAGFGDDGVGILIRSDKGWFRETFDREPGFVTDVVRVGDEIVAVGGNGRWGPPSTIDNPPLVKPAMWVRSAAGLWNQVSLPTTQSGWLTGVAKTDAVVVAVARTAGFEGDAFALSSDHSLLSWTSASLASGAGLQVVTSVAANANSFAAFGLEEGGDPPSVRAVLWTSSDGRTWTPAPPQETADRASELSVLRADGSILSIDGADPEASFPITHLTRYSSVGEPPSNVDLGQLDAIGVKASASVVAAVAVPQPRTGNERVWFFPKLAQGDATHVELPISAKDARALRVIRGSVLESSRNLYFAVKIDRTIRVYQVAEI